MPAVRVSWAGEECLAGVGAFGGGALDEDRAATRASRGGGLCLCLRDVSGAVFGRGVCGGGEGLGDGGDVFGAEGLGVGGEDGGDDVGEVADGGDGVAGGVGRGGFEVGGAGEDDDGVDGRAVAVLGEVASEVAEVGGVLADGVEEGIFLGVAGAGWKGLRPVLGGGVAEYPAGEVFAFDEEESVGGDGEEVDF